jgi:rod shape-determining protein MreC
MPLWDRRRSFVILGGLCALHLLLVSIQVPRGAEKSVFERSVFFVFSPIQRAVTGTIRGIGSAWRNYVDLRGVRAQNRDLKRDVFFLNQEVRFLENRLAQFRSEAELRESLAEFRDGLIPARVIGLDSSNPYQSLVLDKGSLDGVRKDMAVCDRFGNLVGRTIEPVSFKETMVQLITDKESSVSVISAVNRLTGSVTGRSTDICELRYVLASVTTGREGEDLLTTGHDKIYPPGLKVGVITGLQADEASPLFRKITVRPHFRFNALDVVAVLSKAAPGGAG